MKALAEPDESRGLRIAPLIDVVFLLLVFFLVATSFYEEEKDLEVSLAEATEGEERTTALKQMTINIRENGLLVINERVHTLGDLEERLTEAMDLKPDLPVIVRCDKQAPHRHFVRVLNLCEKLEVRNVAVATFKTEE